MITVLSSTCAEECKNNGKKEKSHLMKNSVKHQLTEIGLDNFQMTRIPYNILEKILYRNIKLLN